MRRQKVISIAIALILTLSVSAPALAVTATAPDTAVSAPARDVQGGQDDSMEIALLAVRSIIDIDDDVYTSFNYSSRFSNQQTREGLVWQFNWSDGKNAYIYASVTDGGVLLDYGRYDYSKSGFGFAQVSRADAGKTADGFLKKAAPETFGYYSLVSEPDISINYDTYNFNYSAKSGGHLFNMASISIRVNKFTGVVTSYYTSNADPRSFTFESAPKLITTSAAVKAYAEKLGLTLEYRSYYDYENEKLSVFPVYTASETGDKYISAVTGEVVTYVYDRGGESGMDYDGGVVTEDSAENAASPSGGRSLTPQELEAVKNVGSYITPEQALDKLLAAMELPDLDTSAFNESYINLNRDYLNRDEYRYSISLYAYGAEETQNSIYHLNGVVDAVSGRVLSFTYFMDTMIPEGAKLLTESQAKEKAAAFLSANAPNELKKSVLDDVKSPDADKYSNTRAYYYSYVRTENGTPFRDNGISVSVNAYTGKITSYSLNWYTNVTFPGVANALTPQKALTAYVSVNEPVTCYVTVGDSNAKLVYDFGISGYLDPFTGKAIGYDGKAPESDDASPDYGDVKGHWSEKYVTRLLDNGVYLWSGKFDAEHVMTQLEFLEYLMLLEPWYIVDPLQYFRDRDIKTDIKADDKTPVTRQEAARIITEFLGHGKLAEKSKWFAYPFTGNVDEAYKGYITVCCMLGIITETSGEYNAKAGVTRGEAAMLLHNVVLAKSD